MAAHSSVFHTVVHEVQYSVKHPLQNYALIAEIVAATAVVISLIYVGYQIQYNTSERRAENSRSIYQGYRELALNYVDNSEASIAWHKVLDGKALNNRELDVMSESIHAHLKLLEETYNAFESGYVDEDFLRARVALIQQKILGSENLKMAYLNMKRAGIFSTRFINWLDDHLQQSGGSR